MALAGTLTGRNRDDPAAAGVFALLMYQLINKKDPEQRRTKVSADRATRVGVASEEDKA